MMHLFWRAGEIFYLSYLMVILYVCTNMSKNEDGITRLLKNASSAAVANSAISEGRSPIINQHIYFLQVM